MSRKIMVIPRAPVGRILLNCGAKRVSADAIESFADILTQYAEKIGHEALKIAKHSGRKTIHEGDIKLAVKP